jgi:hypothetical protein
MFSFFHAANLVSAGIFVADHAQGARPALGPRGTVYGQDRDQEDHIPGSVRRAVDFPSGERKNPALGLDQMGGRFRKSIKSRKGSRLSFSRPLSGLSRFSGGGGSAVRARISETSSALGAG